MISIIAEFLDHGPEQAVANAKAQLGLQCATDSTVTTSDKPEPLRGHPTDSKLHNYGLLKQILSVDLPPLDYIAPHIK